MHPQAIMMPLVVSEEGSRFGKGSAAQVLDRGLSSPVQVYSHSDTLLGRGKHLGSEAPTHKRRSF